MVRVTRTPDTTRLSLPNIIYKPRGLVGKSPIPFPPSVSKSPLLNCSLLTPLCSSSSSFCLLSSSSCLASGLSCSSSGSFCLSLLLYMSYCRLVVWCV
ncbi:hypothetical protein OG21DRAFT_950060 [Imleria badia]|nr:hypothetical protein OG21DRAFT_950060 [Imleria badia]